MVTETSPCAFGDEADWATAEALAAAGEAVTDYESEWLEKMIDADGEVDELESRLIARLAEED